MALARGAVPADSALFRLPGLPSLLQELYAVAEFATVRELPWALETPEHPVPKAAAFAKVLDLRDFAFDPAFRGTAMIDFFLTRLGVDPRTVPPAERRNGWLAPRVTPVLPAVTGYVLVCPRASMPLRDMPDAVHADLLATLDLLGLPTVTQGEPVGRAIAMPNARTFGELCGWTSGAVLVVSTDTAMAHLADAFSVPCVAVFTTHRPEWRVRDYPLCHALHRPIAGLPEALEFARSDDDLVAARAAWLDGGVRWLTDAVTAAVASLGE